MCCVVRAVVECVQNTNIQYIGTTNAASHNHTSYYSCTYVLLLLLLLLRVCVNLLKWYKSKDSSRILNVLIILQFINICIITYSLVTAENRNLNTAVFIFKVFSFWLFSFSQFVYILLWYFYRLFSHIQIGCVCANLYADGCKFCLQKFFLKIISLSNFQNRIESSTHINQQNVIVYFIRILFQDTHTLLHVHLHRLLSWKIARIQRNVTFVVRF